MNKVIWADPVRDILLELPETERNAIFERAQYLPLFPYMYPVRLKGRRFRRHRWFQVGNCLVYYRVVDKTIYIRGIWPARIP
jgi:hypothetical protein